ncbi:MAG: DinB family protein [Candidatus Acidiferrales bacterium]
MKKPLITLWILLVMFYSPAIFAQSGTLTPEERSYLIEQLTKSKQTFIDSIQGLTDAQWNYKATPDRWSIEECSEHLILAEDFLPGVSQKMLQAPAQPRAASSTPERDHAIFAMVQDRSHKAAAPEPIRPTGQWSTASAAIAEFGKRRGRNIAYLRDTKDELRVHSTDQTPLGTMDAYQFLVLMAAHTLRHTAQIEEVKASAGYPKISAQLHAGGAGLLE